VSVICRFTTVAALLLHLIFGCSLHHVGVCGVHDHAGRDQSCSTSQLFGLQPERGCDCDRVEGRSGSKSTAEIPSRVDQLTAACCACESQPCDGNHPGCHGEVECSFVPSTSVAFIIHAASIVFVTFEHDPMMKHAISLSHSWRERFVIGVQDSPSRCASLCTWLI
jgi:hypothetical protein